LEIIGREDVDSVSRFSLIWLMMSLFFPGGKNFVFCPVRHIAREAFRLREIRYDVIARGHDGEVGHQC
jgi:hypothetical protein